MSEPFVSEIRMVGFNYAPRGWATCDGQLLNTADHDVLFSLLGTRYGGDGRNTFALPDLRGRAPMKFGQGTGLSSHPLGQKGGAEGVPITADQMPQHTHPVSAANASADVTDPTGNAFAESEQIIYTSPENLVPMNPNCVRTEHAGGPHYNMQPYLTINFIIALVGIYPSRD